MKAASVISSVIGTGARHEVVDHIDEIIDLPFSDVIKAGALPLYIGNFLLAGALIVLIGIVVGLPVIQLLYKFTEWKWLAKFKYKQGHAQAYMLAIALAIVVGSGGAVVIKVFDSAEKTVVNPAIEVIENVDTDDDEDNDKDKK